MRLTIVFLLGLCVAAVVPVGQAQTRKTLDIYVVDVEGGNATLFVAPSGESVLIDTGNGGMAEFAGRIPIRNFIDHGPNVQPNTTADTFLQTTYPELYSKAKHMIAKPGDKLSVTGLDWRLVSSAGKVITVPLPGAGRPNPYCADFKPKDKNDDGGVENTMSVGSVITFGKFRVAHLGDLTWNKEFNMMCPVNRIGTVDLWVVSHHGQPMSNSEVLVHAIQPRVAILNNGTRKGGQPS